MPIYEIAFWIFAAVAGGCGLLAFGWAALLLGLVVYYERKDRRIYLAKDAMRGEGA